MCKLDGDLSFEPEYFEKAFKRFEKNPHIGIGGGILYHYEDGKVVFEKHPVFHVRGGVKLYRRECWEAIDGLWVGPGSDTVDEVKANMLGMDHDQLYRVTSAAPSVHGRVLGAMGRPG